MNGETIQLKGNKFGLQLIIPANKDFSLVKRNIEKKLEDGSKFFRQGTVIHLLPGCLSTSQEESLRRLFHRHGVMFRVEALEKEPEAVAAPAESLVKDQTVEKQEMLVINRTVRGGQEIITPGSILICGNVNPGAQIIAGGSIDIRGVCRGMIHAGAYGDTSAVIIADRLMPTQIRIADRIARSPDGEMEKPKVAEKAFIKQDKIIIESIER